MVARGFAGVPRLWVARAHGSGTESAYGRGAGVGRAGACAGGDHRQRLARVGPGQVVRGAAGAGRGLAVGGHGDRVVDRSVRGAVGGPCDPRFAGGSFPGRSGAGGLEGRVAQRHEPVQISHVDESTVVDPLLWRRGLRALLNVPMVAERDLVGVVHVGSLVDRRFTDEKVDLLRLIADRLAVGVHAHRSRGERDAMAVLQNSLLPARLPETEGWGLAARYVPGAGSGVGGDWYDVFALPGDDWAW
ncbi:MAG: GAF domain-containing protein [Saccharothrix sp.]|nr:GAF domain-containing protein [Saccharothrix sp.]